MRMVVALVLALLAGGAFAQSPVEQMKQIEAALNLIALEQQSVYQQFQMMQELRRSAQQADVAGNAPMYGPDGQPPNYDDMVRARQERDERYKRYSAELDRLYARYRELEQQKRPLLDRLTELAEQRAPR